MSQLDPINENEKAETAESKVNPFEVGGQIAFCFLYYVIFYYIFTADYS